MKLFDCSHVTVWAAVTYRKSNEIHRKIRKVAIEDGYPECVITSEFDTIFLYNSPAADKERKYYMMQTFPNKAVLEGCLTTGEVIIRDKYGVIRGFWRNPTTTELLGIQREAANL